MSISIKAIGIRLKQYITFKRLPANELGRLCGNSGAQISNIIHGKAYGITKLIAIFETCPDLNPRWLFFAEGAMILTEQQQQVLAAQLSAFESDPESIAPFEVASEKESDQLRAENQRLKEETEKLKEEISRLESERIMSNLTIEAYKKTSDTLVITNKELKEVLDFYKSAANLKVDKSA